MIQAIEDMGKLDNTLIIYISGDNGASRRGLAERYARVKFCSSTVWNCQSPSR